MGVLAIKGLLFGVYNRACDFTNYQIIGLLLVALGAGRMECMLTRIGFTVL